MSDTPDEPAPSVTFVQAPEGYPDTIEGPDAAFHSGYDAQTFLRFWCKRAGSKVRGSMLILGLEGSVGILLASTGEVLTPSQIVKQGRATIKAVPTRQ